MIVHLIVSLLLTTAAEPPPLVLDSVWDIQKLPAEVVRVARRVRLTGVVAFVSTPPHSFYLQDKTGGIRVDWAMNSGAVKTGMVVEVIGSTVAGQFLPQIAAETVRKADEKSVPPKPLPFNLTMEESQRLVAQLVVVEAVVQRAWVHDNFLKLELARGRGQAIVVLSHPQEADERRATALRGSVVRVRGVWERSGERGNPLRLLVDSLDAFEELRAPVPADRLPLVTAADLNKLTSEPIAGRLPVRVGGVITMNQGGRQLYVQDSTGVFQLHLVDSVPVVSGQRIVALGFPRAAGTSDPPRLESAIILSKAPEIKDDAPLPDLPAAVPGSVTEAAAGKLEGRVARFTGIVHATGRHGDWQTLTILADNLTFLAVMLGPIDEVEPGSMVEVVGVVTKQQLDKFSRHTFAVFTRAQGLTVLSGPARPVEPPPAPPPAWWTGRRVAYLSATFLGLLLLGGVTVTAMRVQVRRATALARRQAAEKEKLQGQLERAAKLEAAGRVAGGVAHDFNNILTVINGNAQLLNEEIASNPAHAATLAADIRHAGRLATAIIHLLLSFTRQRAVTPHPLDLNAVVDEAAPVLARLIGPRTTLHLDSDPRLPAVVAETGMLLQILINLAANAGEAMPDGGAFTLTTSVPTPGWIRLTATDTGSGMTEEVKARAFERGFTTKATGTGTGLSTVFDIVAALGGKIRLKSEVGRGTEFEIDLPASGPLPLSAPAVPGAESRSPSDIPAAAAGRDDTGTAAPLPTPGSKQTPPPVVLLVDDDEAVHALVRHVLEQAGFGVLSATHPEEALRILAGYAGPLDLLVTDMAMPGINGRELAARVRALRPRVRVLFMSGYSHEDVQEPGDNPADFLHKPFAPRDLTAQARRLTTQSAK